MFYFVYLEKFYTFAAGGNFTKFIEFLSVAGTNGDFVGEMSKYMDRFISEYNSISETKEITDVHPVLRHCEKPRFDFIEPLTNMLLILPPRRGNFGNQ